jgi:uncharacterized protein
MSEIDEAPSLPTPSPTETSDTSDFWRAAREGRLLIRRCRNCRSAIWYPRPICPFCHSSNTGWEEASGLGTIYSFTIIRRATDSFKDAVPYVLAYVELDEGPRIMTNVVDEEIDEVEIGQRVEVVFHRTADGGAIPRFRPQRTGASRGGDPE